MISDALSVVNNLLSTEVLAAPEHGPKIFPIAAGTKDGALTKWARGGPGQEATSDPDQIATWAALWPGCNWGMVTGAKSGMFVVDTDSMDAWLWFTAQGAPPTYTVKTGNPDPYRFQYYFRMPPGIRVKNSASEIAPGVDVRGDGGMVLIPPSLHPSGNRYAVAENREVAEAPEWLIALVKDERADREPVDLSTLEPLTESQRSLGLAIFAKKCRKYAEVPEGQWNNELTKLTYLAGRMAAAGVFTEAEAEALMLAIPTVAEYMEEEPRVVEGNINSGFESGAAAPWDGHETEEYLLDQAGFGEAPLPPGASLEPTGEVIRVGKVSAGEIVAHAEAVSGIELQGIEASLLMLKTQDSVAQIFELKQAGKLLYNHSRGKWMEWDGTRWKFETTEKAFGFVRDLARSVNWAGASSLGSAAFCGGVEKFVQASRVFAVEGGEFDCDNYLLNTPAGTLDLRTGDLREHEPSDRITHCTAVAPSTEGGAVFLKFLFEITLGDTELGEFLQVSLGACLSGAIEDHWMLFWIGQGRNGKNTLGDLIEDVMGDYAVKIPASTLMAKSFESHPTEIAQMQGARIAISSEIDAGAFWQEARIKELTGDATLRARFMRENFFTFQRTQKHLVYGNHRPQLRSVDSAIKSRIKIVPFKASFFGREDKDLPRRLREELGYVLAWLIEGHAKWLAAGKRLPACAAVEAESADYFASQSTPEMWLAERCESLLIDDRPQQQLPKSTDLYRDYSEWKKRRGEAAVSHTRWAEVMLGYKRVKTALGVHYRGLRMLPIQFGDVPFPGVSDVPLPPKPVLQ